jgi:DNA-binding response OmpR family regulator
VTASIQPRLGGLSGREQLTGGRSVAITSWQLEAARVRVLIVEDDRELAEAIGVGLRREQMAVDLAFDGDAGLERALVNGYDVVVLDRDLPLTRGDDVCTGLVSRGCRSRVLMLTAAATIEDRVDGLHLGADDYLPKPFAFAELVARIRALFRRSQPALSPVLERGGVRLDPARRLASRDGRALDLGPKEFGALELLLAAQGRVVSAEELLERVWDEMADPFTTSVKVTISRLRRKLGDPWVIETITRGGYRIGG